MVSIADDPGDELRWWPLYREPEHELVGRIQLYIHYSTSQEENNLKVHAKCNRPINFKMTQLKFFFFNFIFLLFNW